MLVIHDAAVVTLDPAATVHDPGWVAVDGDRIVGTGRGDPDSDLATGAELLDATGCAVIPGLVNAHTHLFQAFFRGLADDKALLDWLEQCIWPGATHLDADAAHLAASIGLVENLLGGVTSVIDHQYVQADPGNCAAVCRAAERLGVRLTLARGWADRNYHPPLTEDLTAVLEHTAALHAEWDGAADGRIRIETGPLIPWGCSDEAMEATIAQARSFGRGSHHHCAETAVEVEMSLAERGVRHVPWLRDLGALGPDAQLAHSVWLDDEEIEIIAATGSVVVHCPVSNMYLASGVPRIPEMRAAGIEVALASDGPGSNNRQDLFEAMKASVLLQKVHHLDPVVLLPEDALDMACRGGAAALGRRDDLGSIEPGRLADLAVVELTGPHVAPVHSVASALVFSATRADVRDVMVDGRWVVRGGAIPGLDLDALLDEAHEAAARVFTAAGITSRVTARRAPGGDLS